MLNMSLDEMISKKDSAKAVTIFALAFALVAGGSFVWGYSRGKNSQEQPAPVAATIPSP